MKSDKICRKEMYKHVFIEGNHLKQALEFDLRILQLSSGQFSAELIISD
jgi:hypothetical protein